MASKVNVYQAVTDRIIKQLEEGVVPWKKPWSGTVYGAHNRVSKKPYSLLNQMLLSHDGEYATFKQWKELGGQVRKGEKSEIVVFWKIFKVKEMKDGKEVEKSIPMLRYYNVFHVSQVDGVEPLECEITEHDPIESAEKIKSDYMEREGIEIEETFNNNAFYSPSHDYISLPNMEQFTDVNEFYATLFHEMTHSTSHNSRLNRLGSDTKIAAFGSEDYSLEELVAEIGSSMLMNYAGIESDKTFKNSTAYIKGWLSVLKNDNKFIVSAASKAEKSTKYILTGEKPSYAA